MEKLILNDHYIIGDDMLWKLIEIKGNECILLNAILGEKKLVKID